MLHCKMCSATSHIEADMVQLVLVYCLVASPATCREQRPIIDGGISAMACMVGGQQAGARWVIEHPRWFLARWRCEIGRPRESHA